MKSLGMMEIKQAIYDSRFRDLFPEYKVEMEKVASGVQCGSCGNTLIEKIIKYPERLIKYFPDRKIISLQEEINNSHNHFKVINCSIHELEEKLKALGTGKKQITIARYEDQITMIVNEILL